MTIKRLSDQALTRLANELRIAHMNADRANDQFNVRTADLNEKMDRQPNVYHDWMTRRTFMVQDVKRRDIIDDFTFWKGEVARLSAVIVAEHALRQLGISVDRD